MKYKVGSNQYKIKARRDVGAYMIGFLYLMILMVLLYDLGLMLKPTTSDASETISRPEPVTQTANPAESKQVVEVTTATPAAILKPQTRVEKLRTFLEEKNSPLAAYAEYIVHVSDENDIPWTLVASIAGKESSFGVHIKPNSYNAWGVMQWDAKGVRSIRSFSSWKEGILFEAKLLSNSYRTNMNKAIQEKYCPSFECSDTWVTHVTGFQKEINN